MRILILILGFKGLSILVLLIYPCLADQLLNVRSISQSVKTIVEENIKIEVGNECKFKSLEFAFW